MSLLDRVASTCRFCERRSLGIGGRCPFCHRHPDYEYEDEP